MFLKKIFPALVLALSIPVAAQDIEQRSGSESVKSERSSYSLITLYVNKASEQPASGVQGFNALQSNIESTADGENLTKPKLAQAVKFALEPFGGYVIGGLNNKSAMREYNYVKSAAAAAAAEYYAFVSKKLSNASIGSIEQAKQVVSAQTEAFVRANPNLLADTYYYLREAGDSTLRLAESGDAGINMGDGFRNELTSAGTTLMQYGVPIFDPSSGEVGGVKYTYSIDRSRSRSRSQEDEESGQEEGEDELEGWDL